MIKNDEGKVYVQYYQPANKYVKVGNNEYVAVAQHAVSMLLAEESDVPALLSVLGGCCGGQRKIFLLPSQEAVNIWLTGTR